MALEKKYEKLLQDTINIKMRISHREWLEMVWAATTLDKFQR